MTERSNDRRDEMTERTRAVPPSCLPLTAQKSNSSPNTPSQETKEGPGSNDEPNGRKGSQKRNKSAGPRLAISESGESRTKDEAETLAEFKPRWDFSFHFSSELEKRFPVSGEVEAKIFSGSKKFVKLDSLLSMDRQPMSCPVVPDQMSMWKGYDDSPFGEDQPATADGRPETSRRESFFQLKKENVAQQRLISVDREQCHKREKAELCVEKVPDIKQQQAVTVCRSNTWSFKNSSEAFEKLRSSSLKRQTSSIETEADLKWHRRRQRQQRHGKQPAVIIERDEEERGDAGDENEEEEEEEEEEERATMSDDTDDRMPSMRRRSNTNVSNVVRSYSIVDRHFRLNQELVMWYKDLSAKMANRSGSGSFVQEKADEGSDDSLVQKCVVLQKDEHGYGLTVAGESPTFVQLVKDNGAAARAGIQKGDKIIKINGSLVTHCSHTEVNGMLRHGSYVNLTLLGRLTPGGQVTSLRNLDELKERRTESPSTQTEDKDIDISTPRAVDASKAGHYLMQKMMTMKMMQKQIREELEHLRQEYENCPSEQLLLRLEAKKQMLDRVQEQLQTLQEADAPPKRPFSAGHEAPDVLSMEGRTTTEFPAVTPPTTRHKKSDSMPDTLYKMAGPKRQSTQSESRVIEGLAEENVVGERSKSSLLGEAGKVTSPMAEATLVDSRQYSGSASTSPNQARSIGSMLRKRCLKVVLPSQVKMGTVEDSVFSTLEDPTIFTDLDQLKSHPAHLSVFLHYVMPNFDPSPMLFHIVTESYPQGSLKELRKWAYEIYSTFLNEKSPLKVNVEDELVAAVEATLTSKHDDEDAMRNVFQATRAGVTLEILNQLSEFRAKRASGLGSIYGECELKDNMDKATELKIIENGLWKYFERLSANKNNDRCKALSSALATFFKGAGLSNSSKTSSLLERCYTFNAKDKKTFKFKTNKKIINGHQYVAQQYYVPTYCHWCHLLFWGIGHQGFQCSHCDINVHKNCVEQTREPCMWSTLKKRKDKKGSQSVFDKIISRKANNPLFVKEPQHMHDILPFASPTFVAGFSTPTIHTTAPVLNGENEETGHRSRFKSTRRPFYRAFSMPSISDFAPNLRGSISSLFKSGRGKRSSSQDPHPEARVKNNNDDSFDVANELLLSLQGSSKSVNRSESLHDKLDAKVNVRRAHSDVSPENQPNQPHLSDSSGCSSNSSLSAKSSEVQTGHLHEGDSSALASQLVSPSSITTNQPPSLLHPLQGQHSFSSFSPGQHNHHQQQHPQQQPQQQHHPFISHSLSSLVVQPQQLQKHQLQQHVMGTLSDSDFEVEAELPSIESYVPKEQLKKLKPKERKRQEVINELFHTEQAHVRNLKVMYRIFYLPMLEEVSLSRDFINLIFPNISGLIECHSALNDAFKAKRSGQSVVGDFAHILEEKFSGEEGEKLKAMAATFCQNQSHCLEMLRLKQKKDAKFAAFLQEAASNPLCRRLELKDLIPTEMQRLTKYPLLIENLLKYTQTNSTEYEVLQKALGHSKSILSYVNQRVKECENLQKLSDLQRRLDSKPIENSMHPVLAEYKKLDLRRHKMIYDGPMTWRICKSKQLEMHAVLLEDILVLLQKPQDSEKLVLRCQSSNTSVSASGSLVGGVSVGGMTGGKDDSKLTHSPIVKLTNILLRDVATDNKAFFLVSISEYGPQIYEFIAMTRDEKNRWVKYIKEAGEACKRKSSSEKIAPATLSHSLRGYMSGNNVVATGGQEAETVQPSGSLPLLSSSISSIIPDDVGQLNVAKIDPSCHQKSQMEPSHHLTREIARPTSRSESCESDSDEPEALNDDNTAIVTIVESDGPEDGALVHPNEVKVSTLEVLEKRHYDAPLPPSSAQLLPREDVPLRDLNVELARAMREKKQIVSAVLGIPPEHYDNLVEVAEEDAEHSTDVKEILLALFAQTDRLTGLVNEKIDSGENKTSSSMALNRMITIPSSQIRLISMKLDHLLVQLMELLILQERESIKTSAWFTETDNAKLEPPEPDGHALHSRNQESHQTTSTTSSVQNVMPTPKPCIESSCVMNLEASEVDASPFETGHVLTTSVNPLFCGTTPTPQQDIALAQDTAIDKDDDGSVGNRSHLVFVAPPTTIYTSTCQLPRLSETRQTTRRPGEDLVGDESVAPQSVDRALTVL